MKIVQARVIPVAFPDPPLRNSTGVHEPFALRNLLRLETDDGYVGWGEASGGIAVTREVEAARETALGLDPWHLEPLRERLPTPRTYNPFEVACLDLVGKATGRPVCDLLG